MPEPRHDIIVVGASVGGVEALSKLAAGLPRDLPAAVFMVLHIPDEPRSRLPEILRAAGPLPAAYAIHGETVEHGRVYIAPPDNHLMIAGKHVHVVRGPKENGHRPAVDPLFRSAAASYEGRVAGVVLTGGQSCGTAGLMSIVARGGVAIAQDPREAICPEMPESAVRHVPATRVLPLDEIAPCLVALARGTVSVPAAPARPQATPNDDPGQHLRVPMVMTCPACHGALTEATVNEYPVFRCHVGHAFGLRSLVSQQAEALEGALWAAVRALNESEELAHRVAKRSLPPLDERLREKAAAMRQHARVLLDVLLQGETITELDGMEAEEPAAE